LPRSDLIEVDGVVTDAMGGGFYKIQTIGENGQEGAEVRARLSGKLKQNHIRVLPGDDVTVGLSPYDLTHGMITYRGRKRR
jgi:translation initiation factor IF-1